MSQKINSILQKALEQVEPPKEDLNLIKNSLKDFLEKLKKEIKKNKINAEIFIGGSFAKKTVIKKDKYDADIFLRFNKKYPNSEISELTKNLLKNFKAVSIVHGSRDYFRISITPEFFIEIIPVIKVSKPEKSENITDLSYSHVKYINKKIKSQKLLNEIRLAKAFCYANHCYGAESYIKGFSGYSLEILIYYYKSFLKFVKAMAKIKEKFVIDVEKYYKNKKQVLMDLNSSKLGSPIILIDPTYKQRNTLAGLSDETFEKFQKVCIKFLKNPSIKLFELQKTDLEKIKKQSEKNKNEFILLQAETDRQEGDIAGSKLLKFYNHLSDEISKLFNIKNKGFNYNHQQSARYFFVTKTKKEILFQGPFIKDEKNSTAFKKQHKSYFIKKGRIYSREFPKQLIKEFIINWEKKNSRKIKEMSINKLEILN